jgi:hypothetical protein
LSFETAFAPMRGSNNSLARGTEGSNLLSSSGESGKLRYCAAGSLPVRKRQTFVHPIIDPSSGCRGTPRNDAGCRARLAAGWGSGLFELCPLSLFGDPGLSVGCSSEWADRGRVVLRADDLYGECIVDDRDDPIRPSRRGSSSLATRGSPFLTGSNK